jgi:hypothetical protein
VAETDAAPSVDALTERPAAKPSGWRGSLENGPIRGPVDQPLAWAGERSPPMSSRPEPAHLSSNHRDTLSQIMRHPVSHNIEWRAVLSLLEAVGSVDHTHDGKFVVSVGSETRVFERPRNKDIDTTEVVDLRRMLTGAGYGLDIQ